MKRFLLFLNSLLFVCAIGLCANDIDSIDVNDQLQRYTFQIETDKAFVSGLLLANESEDVINGSMINEFGVSAIDFTYSKRKQKVKLLNVVSFLNKWYIRMVLKNDLKFCLHILYGTPFNKKHKYEIVRIGNTVSIINHKRNLKYTFTPLNTTDADDTEEQPL